MTPVPATTRHDTVPGADRISVISTLTEDQSGRRALHSGLTVLLEDVGITSGFTVRLDPGTMLAMARLLQDHAARISTELLPLLQPAAVAPAGQEFA